MQPQPEGTPLSILTLLPNDVQDAIVRGAFVIEFARHDRRSVQTRHRLGSCCTPWFLMQADGSGSLTCGVIYALTCVPGGGMLLTVNNDIVLEWPTAVRAVMDADTTKTWSMTSLEEMKAFLPSKEALEKTIADALDAKLRMLYMQRLQSFNSRISPKQSKMSLALIAPNVLRPEVACANILCTCHLEKTTRLTMDQFGFTVEGFTCGVALPNLASVLLMLAAGVITRTIEADRILAFAQQLEADRSAVLDTLALSIAAAAK